MHNVEKHFSKIIIAKKTDENISVEVVVFPSLELLKPSLSDHLVSERFKP